MAEDSNCFGKKVKSIISFYCERKFDSSSSKCVMSVSMLECYCLATFQKVIDVFYTYI